MSADQLALLQEYFPLAFPQRENPRIFELTSLNTGWESDVYAFAVEWGPVTQRQREDLILRIYPGADAQEKSANEFRNLTLLYRAGYPVPRVDCLERDQSPFGRPFLIMERIHGRSMWGPMFHSTPEEQETRLAQFCNLFARLHAVNWRPYIPNPDNYEPQGTYSLVERQLDRWKPFVESIQLSGMKRGWDWIVNHQHDVTSDKTSVVHWDFHPENILLKEDGEAVVIDWTGLDLTDYRFDLAWTLALITSYEGEQWRERILREYERQAGHAVEGIEYFDAVAAFRRVFSVIASLAFGAEKLGMRPGAEEMMRRQAGPLRQVYARFQKVTGLDLPEAEAFLSQAGV